MKAIVIQQHVKTVDELKVLRDVPEPPPLKKGEVLVQVKAAGLNFFDILQVQGKYQNQPPLPFIPGAEFSGVILKVGSSVTNFKVGDRVFGSAQGTFAECVNCPAEQLHHIPASFSFEESAGLFITYPTSYAALTLRAKLQPGEYCLVHAGAGGVGIAAVQIAKALGGIVIATAGSQDKLDICKKFGADFVINYKDSKWTEQVKSITKGHGVDVVYDPVGLVDESMKCIAWNGRILVIGFAKGAFEKVALNRVLLKNISLVGLHWGAYSKYERTAIPDVWQGLFKMFDDGSIKPVIFDRVYNLETIPEGLKAIQARETWGKVVATLEEKNKAKL